MKNAKWLPVLALAVLCTGCSGDPGMVTTEGRTVMMPDGRSVLCVVAVEGSSGSSSVDCDWSK